MSELVTREAWQDGCIYEKHGVVCRKNLPDCSVCGWNPKVQQRHIAAARVKYAMKGGKRT